MAVIFGEAGPTWRTQLMNRLAARMAVLAGPGGTLVSAPDPLGAGLARRGRELLAGRFLFGGQLIEAPGLGLWVATGGADVAAEAQGFGWLDDLAALGTPAARKAGRNWTMDWIARFGRGGGPGWTPELTGRRLLRWLIHADWLLDGAEPAVRQGFQRVAARHVAFLARRWKAAPSGLPRVEALVALIHAGLSLEGVERRVAPAAEALARVAAAEVDARGGLASRAPEELMEVFALLVRVGQALTAAGHRVSPEQRAAVARMVPVLRALRHADGGLARFHGGGAGAEGRLDQALAAARVRVVPPPMLAMGFARLAAGRTTVIVDAAEPPGGVQAHASTLAFELTSGRRPLIVSCGSGAGLGAEWRRAGRATPSHSTLAIDGFSSSRMGTGAQEVMLDRARVLSAHQGPGPGGLHLHVAHSGWSGTHGLTHRRDLVLAADGRRLAGTDTLAALTAAERRRFEVVMQRTRARGVRHALRFHLHPDVQAEIDPEGTVVTMLLKSGEVWRFRHEGSARLTLDPSVYLEEGRPRPRATKQIVLSSVAMDFEDRIGWTLAKTEDTPLAIRDLDRDDLPDRL